MVQAFDYQESAFAVVNETESNLLVVAPMGAGKTNVGFKAIRKPGKGIYVCPTRTLCYEKWKELRMEFPDKTVAIANQDFPMSRHGFRSADIRVMTPFKLLDFLNNLDDFSAQAPVVILDEVDEMDFNVEIIYALLLALCPKTRVVALSGTIAEGDVPRLGSWLGNKNSCEVVQSDVRPKELIHHVARIKQSVSSAFATEPQRTLVLQSQGSSVEIPARQSSDPTVAALLGLYGQIREVNDQPILVWSPRRFLAGTLLQACIDSLPRHSSFPKRDKSYRDEIKTKLEALPEPKTWASRTLRKALLLGLGLHHGGLLAEEQRLVEDLSKEGKLDLVVGCMSMCRGIHHPFGHTVIATVRDPAQQYGSPLMDISRYHQVAGRAGRVGFGNDAPGHVWTICQTKIDEVEVLKVLHAHRASAISSNINSSRSLTILLASLILGDQSQRFRQRNGLLTFLQNLYSASGQSKDELESLLDVSLEEFARFGMLEQRPFGYWLTNGGQTAARLGVHPLELHAIEALCESSDEAEFADWVEVIGELYPKMTEDSETEDSDDVQQALSEVVEYGLAVYSYTGLSQQARPLADYIQRILDRVQAWCALNRVDKEAVKQWRQEVYLKFILGGFKTAWALSAAINHDGTLRRLVRSLGKMLAPTPESLDDYERHQIARCLYAQGRKPSQREIEAVAEALCVTANDWKKTLESATAEEV